MNVLNVLLAALKIRNTKVPVQSNEGLKTVDFESLLFEDLGFGDGKIPKKDLTVLSVKARRSVFTDNFKKLMALTAVNHPVPVVHTGNSSSRSQFVKVKPISYFKENGRKKGEFLSDAVRKKNLNQNIKNFRSKEFQRKNHSVSGKLDTNEKLLLPEMRIIMDNFPLTSKKDRSESYQPRKLQEKLYVYVDGFLKNSEKPRAKILTIDQKGDLKRFKYPFDAVKKVEYPVTESGKSGFIGEKKGEGVVKTFFEVASKKKYPVGSRSDFKEGSIYSGFAGYRNRITVSEIYSSVSKEAVWDSVSTERKNSSNGLKLSEFSGSRSSLVLRRNDLKTLKVLEKKSSFPPGKLPLKWEAASDRRSAPPVHLFEQTTGSLTAFSSLLSDTATNLQYKENDQFYGTLPGKENSLQMSFNHYSSNYPHTSIFSWSFDSSSGFNDFGGGEDSPFKNGQVEEEKSVFRLSYADKSFKLSVFTQGKVLNLNLNFLESFRIDPSVVKDIASIIENSGFIPGKITLRQKKERYTYSDRRVDSKLELKV